MSDDNIPSADDESIPRSVKGDEETNVYLSRFDMDHLAAGQPVFKEGKGDELIVLRFDEPEEWNRTPNEELRELVEELRQTDTGYTASFEDGLHKAADKLEQVIGDE